ncbi:DUF1798 family protein [Macrococcus sp. DPC7161]|uniref:DUF1798 family protein n=1 Tax=Macrococcus sp. DPC7161 TaxID=2507060 RepID=UPI00100A2736|nr:DUF1798 family protein [Macrococcus sp. DPC7161]RXK19254.1 DUF1798 family protein [Macrococcus sp. DPC7161]
MLQECIKDLIEDLQKINDSFIKAKEGNQFDFYLIINPFTKKVDQHIESLLIFQKEIIALPLMNPMKLHLLIAHLKELSVECFYEKTSKKLFLDKFKAVQHDLKYLERSF